MTAKAEGPRGLHVKLAEVMAAAGRIPKNGSYKKPGEYGHFMFVQVGDAADAIRTALGERQISMLPSAVEVVTEAEHETKSGGTMSTVTIRTTWTLVDGETGETATIQSIGTGADAGDKATPKAQTNAMKYALLMGFLLSTGDDPENHDSTDRVATSPSADETAELLGRVEVRGKATKGGSQAYMGDWRETPDGHAIGFKLQRPGDKDIPQVLISYAVGSGLFAADPGATFMGHPVAVKGRLYAVKVTGRTTYHRLVVGEGEDHYIETPDWRIPALSDATTGSVPVPPVPDVSDPPGHLEAGPADAPFDMAEVDREAAKA